MHDKYGVKTRTRPSTEKNGTNLRYTHDYEKPRALCTKISVKKYPLEETPRQDHDKSVAKLKERRCDDCGEGATKCCVDGETGRFGFPCKGKKRRQRDLP